MVFFSNSQPPTANRSKIFSREELPQQLLSDLFESDPGSVQPRVLYSRRWHAYPRFRPPEHFSPFVLAPGLLYGNALEPAASAMEMAAIAAHNSAALVVRHLAELYGAADAAAALAVQAQGQYQEQ
ncbi:hypothetical protein VOLCADRAFT_96741 [Volvox carteri f. nagariensis]|uniref:Prenylcysteine lyase domain-containing protein n=1 Tax=Volvox carteri f. nagariensis TaxID=3068 RepID=D8UAX5_VOLCA|nr:uncharacterized protein VOLCADRAFT_96741 [Volvox carteri f. nagariensis]EFJ43010.1 hypothetical protein VOLCADRAFT_96741 [Volvox carteri f. nagariensis]|eukprot:XP_002955809.1 hypothetical protein VOLCADRAFT_96741 [Volvox carteri f. nagariensis]